MTNWTFLFIRVEFGDAQDSEEKKQKAQWSAAYKKRSDSHPVFYADCHKRSGKKHGAGRFALRRR